jgi:hypothetical protein
MPLNKAPLIFAAKLAVILWGAISVWQGAALSFFVSGAHQYRQTAFIELVYESVLVAGLVSLLSSRVAGFLLCGAVLASAALLFWTGTFGHGPASAPPLLLAIAIRPALGALVLLFISRYEGPWIMEMSRLLANQRKKEKRAKSMEDHQN